MDLGGIEPPTSSIIREVREIIQDRIDYDTPIRMLHMTEDLGYRPRYYMSGVEGLAFDGTYLWAANRKTTSLTKLRAFDSPC